MLPKLIRPMLAVEAKEPFDSDDHLFEIKWDGIRCLAFIEAGRVRLHSRELVEITAQFPELEGLAGLPDGTVVDGELVSMRGGVPSLAAVQSRVKLRDRNRIQLLSRFRPSDSTYQRYQWSGRSVSPAHSLPLATGRTRNTLASELV
jgi:bifunctional non-homologous end joining protein LigD